LTFLNSRTVRNKLRLLHDGFLDCWSLQKASGTPSRKKKPAKAGWHASARLDSPKGFLSHLGMQKKGEVRPRWKNTQISRTKRRGLPHL
jgi:hypothetical protein